MVVGDFGLVPVGVAAVGFGGFHSKRIGLSFEGGPAAKAAATATTAVTATADATYPLSLPWRQSRWVKPRS